MQVLDDIWTSVKGNAKTRINDPIIGAFAISWGLCNWDRLALLFWGVGKLDARINIFSQEVSFISEPSLIWTNHALLLLPLLITAFYIFVLPSVAHAIEKKLKPTQINRHAHIVELDLGKVIKQKELNKARLRANPDNEFLAQEVKLDIEKEKSEAATKKAESESAINKQVESKAKADLAQAEAEIAINREKESKAKADIEARELEKREIQIKNQKSTLAASTAKHKAELTAQRFPSSYIFIESLSERLKKDNVIMSLSGLTKCISAIFGYEGFEDLINDKQFNQENLEQLKYVLLDAERSTIEFSEILEEEGIEKFDSKWLIEHLEIIFKELSFEFIYPKALADIMQDEIDIYNLDFSTFYGMDEIPTAIENIDGIELNEYYYDEQESAFIISFSGSASGSHVAYSSVSGPAVEFSIEAKYNSIIGGFGFGELEVNGSVNAKEAEEINYS